MILVEVGLEGTLTHLSVQEVEGHVTLTGQDRYVRGRIRLGVLLWLGGVLVEVSLESTLTLIPQRIGKRRSCDTRP